MGGGEWLPETWVQINVDDRQYVISQHTNKSENDSFRIFEKKACVVVCRWPLCFVDEFHETLLVISPSARRTSTVCLVGKIPSNSPLSHLAMCSTPKLLADFIWSPSSEVSESEMEKMICHIVCRFVCRQWKDLLPPPAQLERRGIFGYHVAGKGWLRLLQWTRKNECPCCAKSPFFQL